MVMSATPSAPTSMVTRIADPAAMAAGARITGGRERARDREREREIDATGPGSSSGGGGNGEDLDLGAVFLSGEEPEAEACTEHPTTPSTRGNEG